MSQPALAEEGSDTLARLARIRAGHLRLTRALTLALSGAVCAALLSLWWLRAPLLDEHKPLLGLALMALAFVFYRIPYFAFLCNRFRCRARSRDLELMGTNWRAYRRRIVS